MNDDAQRKTERDAPDRREDLGGSGKPGGPADPLRQSRTSWAWVAASLLALLLVLLIILVVQNTQKVEVSFLGWNGQTPLAVALLVAAVAGLAVTGSAGTLRILQLRRRIKHLQNRRD